MTDHITITQDQCTSEEIDLVADLVCETIAEKRGHMVKALSFSIQATYEPDEDSDSEED
jgi:hypothetical protein